MYLNKTFFLVLLLGFVLHGYWSDVKASDNSQQLFNDVWTYNLNADTDGSKASAIEKQLSSRTDITNSEQIWIHVGLVNIYWKLWEKSGRKNGEYFYKHIFYMDKIASLQNPTSDEMRAVSNMKSQITNYANDSLINHRGTCQQDARHCGVWPGKLEEIYKKYLN